MTSIPSNTTHPRQNDGPSNYACQNVFVHAMCLLLEGVKVINMWVVTNFSKQNKKFPLIWQKTNRGIKCSLWKDKGWHCNCRILKGEKYNLRYIYIHIYIYTYICNCFSLDLLEVAAGIGCGEQDGPRVIKVIVNIALNKSKSQITWKSPA